MVIQHAIKLGIGSNDCNHELTAIDLFSGCGGMSLGFKQAGFNVVLGVDVDFKANQEYLLNLGSTPHQLESLLSCKIKAIQLAHSVDIRPMGVDKSNLQ